VVEKFNPKDILREAEKWQPKKLIPSRMKRVIDGPTDNRLAARLIKELQTAIQISPAASIHHRDGFPFDQVYLDLRDLRRRRWGVGCKGADERICCWRGVLKYNAEPSSSFNAR
jgi:hypothetical protein